MKGEKYDCKNRETILIVQYTGIFYIHVLQLSQQISHVWLLVQARVARATHASAGATLGVWHAVYSLQYLNILPFYVLERVTSIADRFIRSQDRVTHTEAVYAPGPPPDPAVIYPPS